MYRISGTLTPIMNQIIFMVRQLRWLMHQKEDLSIKSSLSRVIAIMLLPKTFFYHEYVCMSILFGRTTRTYRQEGRRISPGFSHFTSRRLEMSSETSGEKLRRKPPLTALDKKKKKIEKEVKTFDFFRRWFRSLEVLCISMTFGGKK